MFTVKYRRFQPCSQQPIDGPTFYDKVESIAGPFEHISQEYVDGLAVVYAHREGGAPGMTYGPVQADQGPPGTNAPRPTLWVMNDSGATVATYDL